MKKTLFTLCTLASAAVADTTPTPVYSWEWTAEGGANISASGWHNSFDYTEGNDYATIGSNKPWMTSFSGFNGENKSFTLSMDLKNLSAPNTNWNSIVCLYSNGEVSGNNHSLQLQFNTSGTLMLYNSVGSATPFGDTPSDNINTGLTSAVLQQNVWTNISIVSDVVAHTLSVYVNGSLAGSTEWNPASPAITGAQFGAAFGSGGHALSGTIDVNNIKFYNSAVYPASTDTVPEPATATLSLLALAGLAVRRRRK